MGILVLAGLVLGWSGSVAAKGRVGVRILGTQEGPTREAVAQLLSQRGFSVVDGAQLEKTAAKLHRGLDTQADLQAIASKMKLSAVVAGEVSNGTRAGIVVRSGATGRITAKGTWSAPGGARALADAIKASGWARLGPGLSGGGDESRRVAGRGGRRNAAADAAAEAAVAAAQAELEDEGEPAPRDKAAPKLAGKSDAELEREAGIAAAPAKDAPPEPPPKARSDADLEREAGLSSGGGKRKGDRSGRGRKPGQDDEDALVARPGARRGDGGRGLTALELGVGPRLLWRSLTFGGNAGGALVPFSMNGTPTFGANLAWYPGAHVATGGLAANIGIAANAEYASAINSKASDGASFPTATSDMFGGLRVRLPIRSAALTATGGYGRHAFVFHSGATTDRANINVPDTDNKYLRAAGDLFVPLAGAVSLSLGAGYRQVLGPGKAQYQIASEAYFPDATVTGIDATVGLGYRFLSVMELRMSYDLRRYTYKTHGGASAAPLPSFVDSYSAVYFSLGLTVDGPPRQARKPASGDEDDDEG